MTARADSRERYDELTRLSLLEDDLDNLEVIVRELRAELGSMRKLLVGILVSVTTASILLVVNILTIGGN